MGQVGSINHIVVLMLENRSFDCLLGKLYPKSDTFEGLSGTEKNPAQTAPSCLPGTIPGLTRRRCGSLIRIRASCEPTSTSSCLARLERRNRANDQVLGDARLRDFKPEFEQFAMDARRSRNWVLDTHPPDQRTEV